MWQKQNILDLPLISKVGFHVRSMSRLEAIWRMIWNICKSFLLPIFFCEHVIPWDQSHHVHWIHHHDEYHELILWMHQMIHHWIEQRGEHIDILLYWCWFGWMTPEYNTEDRQKVWLTSVSQGFYSNLYTFLGKTVTWSHVNVLTLDSLSLNIGHRSFNKVSHTITYRTAYTHSIPNSNFNLAKPHESLFSPPRRPSLWSSVGWWRLVIWNDSTCRRVLEEWNSLELQCWCPVERAEEEWEG